jgi:hypothetical protein
MKHLQTEKAPSSRAPGKINPDIIVRQAAQTTVFKMQGRRASEWLREHYRLATGTVKGDTEIHVHPTRCKRIIEELKAAGFLVIGEKEELC